MLLGDEVRAFFVIMDIIDNKRALSNRSVLKDNSNVNLELCPYVLKKVLRNFELRLV